MLIEAPFKNGLARAFGAERVYVGQPSRYGSVDTQILRGPVRVLLVTIEILRMFSSLGFLGLKVGLRAL